MIRVCQRLDRCERGRLCGGAVHRSDPRPFLPRVWSLVLAVVVHDARTVDRPSGRLDHHRRIRPRCRRRHPADVAARVRVRRYVHGDSLSAGDDAAAWGRSSRQKAQLRWRSFATSHPNGRRTLRTRGRTILRRSGTGRHSNPSPRGWGQRTAHHIDLAHPCSLRVTYPAGSPIGDCLGFSVVSPGPTARRSTTSRASRTIRSPPGHQARVTGRATVAGKPARHGRSRLPSPGDVVWR